MPKYIPTSSNTSRNANYIRLTMCNELELKKYYLKILVIRTDSLARVDIKLFYSTNDLTIGHFLFLRDSFDTFEVEFCKGSTTTTCMFNFLQLPPSCNAHFMTKHFHHSYVCLWLQLINNTYKSEHNKFRQDVRVNCNVTQQGCIKKDTQYTSSCVCVCVKWLN